MLRTVLHRVPVTTTPVAPGGVAGRRARKRKEMQVVEALGGEGNSRCGSSRCFSYSSGCCQKNRRR